MSSGPLDSNLLKYMPLETDGEFSTNICSFTQKDVPDEPKIFTFSSVSYNTLRSNRSISPNVPNFLFGGDVQTTATAAAAAKTNSTAPPASRAQPTSKSVTWHANTSGNSSPRFAPTKSGSGKHATKLKKRRKNRLFSFLQA